MNRYSRRIKGHVLDEFGRPEVSKMLVEGVGNIVSYRLGESKLSISDIPKNLVPDISTFFIGSGLAVLGSVLASKYRKSRTTRIIEGY